MGDSPYARLHVPCCGSGNSSVVRCDNRPALRVRRRGPTRSDRAEDSFFVTKLESDYPPRNLRFVRMCQDLESRRELRMRNHVGAHIAAVDFRVLRPFRKRLSVYCEHQQRMMCGNIATGKVAVVLVAACGHDQIRVGCGAQLLKQISQRDAADLG
jgi:hypothetical protein